MAGDPLTDPIKTPLDPSTPTAAEAAEDIGGGDPGEALSDSAEQPHDVTTPDNPAEVVDVNQVPDDKRD